MEESFIGEHSE